MRVTACFVTRDHAHVLGRALYSIRGFADESVVVDTGSTDGTVTVATDAGAKTLTVAWADDFSVACNAALAAATGDWILWLNPDELLEPPAKPILAQAVRDGTVFAYGLTVVHQLEQEQPNRVSVDVQPRLFRNGKGVRYRGRLHPDFDPPLHELAKAAGQAVVHAPTNATLRRLAFLSPVTPDKVRWTNRLIEAELADRPDRLDLKIELGRNLLRLNDPRGHEVLGSAADALPDTPRPPVPNAGELLEYLLTADPATVRGRLTRADARQLADRWYPVSPPVVWAVAGERFAAGDYEAAVEQLRRLLEMGRTGLFDRSAAFDPDIVGPMASLNLATAFAKLGRADEAKAALAPLASNSGFRDRAAALYRAID